MKKIFVMIVLMFPYEHIKADCVSTDTACVAQLLADVSDDNDQALLGMIIVGAGGFYLWNNNSKEEQENIMQSLKNGNGLPLINNNKYDLNIFPKKLEIESNFKNTHMHLDINKSFDIDIVKFRYKFN
tara:strand:+ start:531 stop:914 length:384 start_codon:yes stop_codon:yes gene_type:complete